MSVAAILFATLRFALWEAALFGAALASVRNRRDPAERWLLVLAIQVTLESSIAALLSFARLNWLAIYVVIALVCAVAAWRLRSGGAGGAACPAASHRLGWPVAALAAPLILLSFRPVEEIDSINYLHYLIDWMGNRATPFTFATNYVAFWELSFLPAWMVTGADLFFPILALKAVVLLGLACWLLGRELGLRDSILLWTIAGSLAMRHFWFEYSGVPTLKNDALHGAGFALLVLAVIRASRSRLGTADAALLAFGAAFSTVKYTGVFLAVIALGIILFLRALNWRGVAAVAVLFLFTSGPYYLRSLIQHGSPFYPFQINAGFLHLPGTADLSYTSIMYNLHDPRLWRAFFLPAGGVSPAGLLFPAILAGTLLAATWRCLVWLKRRGSPTAMDWTALLLLGGWVLYFRSVFSATGEPGALSFVLNSLNSVRYVDGVLAVSELFLTVLLGPIALPLVAINGASRLILLYRHLPVVTVVLLAIAAGLLVWALARFAPRATAPFIALCLIVSCPWLVEANRRHWTTYWNDLKPQLELYRPRGLALLAMEDGGYFAGHIVAAGNPVDSWVRTVTLNELDRLSLPYLAVLVTPGSAAAAVWQADYLPKLAAAGYKPIVTRSLGAILQRTGVE